METETIDKLFLELSQVTKATTKRETDLLAALSSIRNHWREFGPEYGFDELIERTCAFQLEGKSYTRDEDTM